MRAATRLACYTDSWNRIMPNNLEYSSSMTMTRCQNLAAAQGYPFFGVESTNECWATTSLALSIAAGISTGCTQACGGDSSAKCGGGWALNTYSRLGECACMRTCIRLDAGVRVGSASSVVAAQGGAAPPLDSQARSLRVVLGAGVAICIYRGVPHAVQAEQCFHSFANVWAHGLHWPNPRH